MSPHRGHIHKAPGSKSRPQGRRKREHFSFTLAQLDTSLASVTNPSEAGDRLKSTSRLLRVFFLLHSMHWPFPS